MGIRDFIVALLNTVLILILAGVPGILLYYYLINRRFGTQNESAFLAFISFIIIAFFAAKYFRDMNGVRRSRRKRDAIPPDLEKHIWLRDGGQCKWCGSRTNVEIDHITPVVEGGTNTPQNLRLLCRNCNRSKGASLI